MNNISFKIDDIGKMKPFSEKVERNLSDMKSFYKNQEAVEKRLKEDPLIYEVYGHENEGEGNLSFATTIMHPGKIGNEYFMTKGHFHTKKSRSEVYYCLDGEGYLLIEDRKGNSEYRRMFPNSLVYVPPGHAHRSINTGDNNFVFLAVYPSDAGHEYGPIKEQGFSKIFIEKNNELHIVNNSK